MQRFASSLLARPVVSSFARTSLFRSMSVSAGQIKEHALVYDSEGKEFAKIESGTQHTTAPQHSTAQHTTLPLPALRLTVLSSWPVCLVQSHAGR